MVKLWGHQEAAVRFAMDRNATLFHMGMGTGKTLCAITVAQRMNATGTVVLCPRSVIDAWVQQVNMFWTDACAIPLTKGTASTKAETMKAEVRRCAALGQPWVVVVNYESARMGALADAIERLQPLDLVVLDEIHRIKAPGGATSRWVARMAPRAKRRLGLTGTPMPHSPLDVYAQLRALDPSVFGWSFVRFRKEYAVMGGFGGKEVKGFQNLDRLQAKMGRMTFQADRSVLDLPEAMHERRVVQLDAKARKLYSDLDRDFVAQVQDGEVTAANALVKLLRLQQLTSGYARVEHKDTYRDRCVDTAKADALRSLLEDLPRDEPVVVFGRFSCDLANVRQVADDMGRGVAELSGRCNELSDWQRRDGPPILAVQIQSGGTGIDLTRARICVYMSTGYSLGDYEQSLARVHRPGQRRGVLYVHFVAENTIDERVHQALKDRKRVVESILDGIHNPQPSR
jgi:SNF2 family DNA or RNA helicase